MTGGHRCMVFGSRPHDRRDYMGWNQSDETVYGYAVFLQNSGNGKNDLMWPVTQRPHFSARITPPLSVRILQTEYRIRLRDGSGRG